EGAVLAVAGVEAQGQQLVEEGPQEGEPEADPEQGQGPTSQRRGGVGVLGGRHGGGVRVPVDDGHGGDLLLSSLGGASSLVEGRRPGQRTESPSDRALGPEVLTAQPSVPVREEARRPLAGAASTPGDSGRSPASPRAAGAAGTPSRRTRRGASRPGP